MVRLWRCRSLLAALLLAALAAGCGDARRPSLVLITVDTTRADHLGTYGYDRATSPHIDALAARSVRFEHAFAHVPITLPSHTSMMTGTIPVFHGVRDNGRFVVREDLVTLAEAARGAGYRTAAFVSAFVLESRFGLDQGFEVYDDEFSADWSEEDMREARLYNAMVTERPADQTTDRAVAWLEGIGDEPFFLWVHYYDPHQRYRPPAPYNGMFAGALYDGEIAFMDAQIGRLLERLRSGGRFEDSLVVLASDHGESLGQHGEQTHAVLTYDSTMRVAWLVKPPAGAGIEPGIDSRSVSLRDLFPTVAELMDLPIPDQVQGVPLLGGGRRDPARDRPIYFECHLPRFGYGWAPMFGVRAEGWKYIHGPRPELYHLAEDPEELFNRAGSEPERRRAYEELLFAQIRRESAPESQLEGGREFDAETRAKLAALGYVSGGEVAASELTPREPTGRRDPRATIAILNDYFVAQSLTSRGQFEQAALLYDGVLLRLDPANPTFLRSRGDIARELGDLEGALEAYRRAQAADPADPSILVDLGRLEMDRGRPQAAEDLLQAARQLDAADLSAAYFLARAAQELGRHEEALQRFEAALAIDPSHRDSLLQRALELGRLGRLDEARRELRAMLEATPFSARLHYNLGIVEYRSRRPEAAAEAFEKALRYRPSYLEARYALGLAKAEAGDRQGARTAFEEVVAQDPESERAGAARRALAELGGA